MISPGGQGGTRPRDSSAATAADDFQGIWRATWENGDETKLTIVGIDDQGRAVGAYCHQTNQERTSYVDLHPDAILAQLDNTAADVLRIERPQRRWTFQVDADVVNLRFQFQQAIYETTLPISPIIFGNGARKNSRRRLTLYF